MKLTRQPDIVAKVHFYGTERGGRNQPTPINIYRCLFEFEGEKFDCGLHLDMIGPIAPGETTTVPITFIFSEMIKPRLKVGNQFTLSELRTIAEGIVEEILNS